MTYIFFRLTVNDNLQPVTILYVCVVRLMKTYYLQMPLAGNVNMDECKSERVLKPN